MPDVLGDDRPLRQVPKRAVAVVVTGSLLVAGGVVGTRTLLQDRAEQQARDAAFAIADRVHLRARVDGLYGQGPGSRLVGVDVSAVPLPGRPPDEQVTALAMEGAGLVPQPPIPASAAVEFPPLSATSAVDCAAVQAGQGPARAELVMTVTALSGVPHQQRVPVDPVRLRQLSLEVCDLPDPLEMPLAEAYGLDGRPFLVVQSVPRDDADLRLTAVQVSGLTVRLDGLDLPLPLARDTVTVVGLVAEVDDCDLARSGGLALRVVLTRDGVETVRAAGPNVGQPQPGSVPLAEVLEDLVDRSC